MGAGLKTVHEVFLPRPTVQRMVDGKRMREIGMAKAGPDAFFHGSLKLPPDRNLSRLADDFRKDAACLCRADAGLRLRESRRVKGKSVQRSIARLKGRKEEASLRCRALAEQLGAYPEREVLLRLKPKDRTMRQIVGLIIGIGLVRVAEVVLLASTGYGATIAVSASVLTYLAWRTVLQVIIRKSSREKPQKDPLIGMFLALSRNGGGSAEESA